MEDKGTKGQGDGGMGRQGDGETGKQEGKDVLSPVPPSSRLPVSPSPRLFVSISLFLIPLIYFYPVLLGKVILAPGDGWAQNFPMRALTGQMLLDGQLPLWNPYIFAGMPLMASLVAGAFYPPNWLFAILPAGVGVEGLVVTAYHL